MLRSQAQYLFFFFFQAEDGIRDYKVTGVQTCALPISISRRRLAQRVGRHMRVLVDAVQDGTATARSEADAPQIDGVVRIENPGKLRAGDWAEVRIVAADDYDLTGQISPQACRGIS